MNTGKKWSLLFLILSVAAMLFICALTIVIDPYFHYHGPLDALQYPIEEERYQNDGILKHFSYDAILTGTSMTENFRTSECDALFGVHSVKTSLNGSSLKEVNDQLQRAIDANPEIKLVIRGLDGWNLFDDKDHMRVGDELPTFLYDDNPLNDVEYLLNKQILCQDTIEVLKYTVKGYTTTSFDEYSSWASYVTFGEEVVKGDYTRPEKSPITDSITEADVKTITETLQQNVIQIARDNPDIQFYYFFTPYSILYMDEQNQYGILERQFDAYLLASELLLETDNIHLFSFFADYDTITNLDNYYDTAHYSDDINSLILQRMCCGDYELTKENYKARWQEVREYYCSYDYDALFAEQGY